MPKGRDGHHPGHAICTQSGISNSAIKGKNKRNHAEDRANLSKVQHGISSRGLCFRAYCRPLPVVGVIRKWSGSYRLSPGLLAPLLWGVRQKKSPERASTGAQSKAGDKPRG